MLGCYPQCLGLSDVSTVEKEHSEKVYLHGVPIGHLASRDDWQSTDLWLKQAGGRTEIVGWRVIE